MFRDCVWKKCPDDIDEEKKYNVDEKNPRIATRINTDGYCLTIGDTPIPLNTISSWSIKVLESKNSGSGVFIGVTYSDINQNDPQFLSKGGWYFGCLDSTLLSGPPHNYKDKKYGPREERGQYVHTGDSIGVVMDTTKGDLSFVLNVNLGVAYEGIPLDKPLVPCVLFHWKGDSVELDTSEVKENVDSSIPVPPNIASENIARDAITLTWDEVEGASFYQVDVDGTIYWGEIKYHRSSLINTFTKKGLIPGTEHNFRVRTVIGDYASEWSDVVKGTTQKWECAWKEWPDDVDNYRRYSVDEKNPRIATKVDGIRCAVIGDTPIPLNTITSWSIKILKSKNNNGNEIYIGVAQNDINQNDTNYYKCTWCINCYSPAIYSKHSYDYIRKEFIMKYPGQYVHTGDSVGVKLNTAKGDLSFVLNGVNLGVAYKEIPLDKPLVPCVILGKDDDSVELII